MSIFAKLGKIGNSILTGFSGLGIGTVITEANAGFRQKRDIREQRINANSAKNISAS